MEQEKLDRAIRYVLRYAIEHNGKAYFNPCMYYLGFADNIQPPTSFDDELNKYGEIHYDTHYDLYDDECYTTWSYFQIDDRGIKYIKEIEPSGIGKLIRIILCFILSVIQLPFIVEGWISFFLNYILKVVSSIFFPFAILSFVWLPIDFICGVSWSCCDYLKYKIWNRGFSWNASVQRWTSHFPEL